VIAAAAEAVPAAVEVVAPPPTPMKRRPFHQPLDEEGEPEVEWHVRLGQHLIIVAVQTAGREPSKRAGRAAEIEEARDFLMGATPEHMTMLQFWCRVAGWNAAAITSHCRKQWGAAKGLASGYAPAVKSYHMARYATLNKGRAAGTAWRTVGVKE
jgi:hypothetical protein